MPTYARADLAFERGQGAYLFTADGRRYLDFGSGIAVTGLGHAHPHLVAALTAQAAKVWHVSNIYRIPEQERLARRLVDASFADTVFFGNSGAEAIECGIKMVRKYHDATGHPERYRIITFEGAFHGRTLATISAGKQPKHVAGFDPLVDGFDQVPFNDGNALRAAIGRETAAILVEPVQGESGIRSADPRFLQELRRTADEFGLLLFYDEVQTGMGRTGKLFAHEWSGAKPDVMAVAKALGGGVPVGACLATAAAAQGMTAGTHGSTFGGNPLAMAAANAVLDVMLADGFLESVQKHARLLRTRLDDLARRHPKVIAEVRGQGLLLGLRLVPPANEMIEKLRGAGLLTIPAGDNVVRILPPLIVGEAEIDEAIRILDGVCAELGA
ncbi:MAG: aspartate aminotransferase family protein [Alphaproteobacteria bacterium]|nr:aspartate aminotransferase family protein [Alphaproteobacteria bacterium]